MKMMEERRRNGTDKEAKDEGRIRLVDMTKLLDKEKNKTETIRSKTAKAKCV